MPTLRTLLSSLEAPKIGNPLREFFVFNSNYGQQNGGCCCLWTVPNGTTSVTFELWGGGGDGEGARCCEWGGVGANSGSYAILTIDVTAGRQYRLCAAGTGCDGDAIGFCCGISTRGFPSYVFDVTAGTNIACACGGAGGNNDITRGSVNGYVCCYSRLNECGTGDIAFAGTGTWHMKTQFCNNQHYDIIAGGGGSTGRSTFNFCASTMFRNGQSMSGSCPSFPGGVGGHARQCSGNFCGGQHGAGGLIKVTYS